MATASSGREESYYMSEADKEAQTQSVRKAMFAHAHVFVRLHTRMNDGDHVAVMTVDPCGDMILVTVMSRDCRTHEARLDANEMLELKDGLNCGAEVSWGAFFDLIQRCFVDRAMELADGARPLLKLQLKHERPTDVLPAPAFNLTLSIPMQLASPQEGAVAKTVASMVAYLSLRTGDRREAEKIEDLCRLDDQLKEDAAQILAESDTLRNEVMQFKAETQAAEAQIAELQQMLNSNGLADLAGWSDALHSHTQAQWSSRVPKDWVTRHPTRHNTRLLKSIKVKWPFTAMITKGAPLAAQPSAGGDIADAKPAAPPAATSPATNNDEGFDLVACFSTTTRPVRGEHLRYCNVVPADKESQLPPLSKDEEDVFLELGQMDDWNFHVHEFDALCRKTSPKSVGALYYLGYAVFMRLGLCARFNMSESGLLEWLAAVEAGYRQVPFHNALHAADALHCVYYIIAQAEGIKRLRLVNDHQILAVVIAAILIDFDHPGNGITNDYIRVAPPSFASLAYPGQNVLEQHHVSAGFELMKHPECNFLECLPASKRAEVQALAARLVLATDLGRHDVTLAVCNKAGQAPDFGTHADDTEILLGLLLKAADVGFAAKSTNTYSYWVHRLLKELAALSELEQKLNVRVTGIAANASNDRKAAMQLNHLNFVVLPTYASLSDFVPKMRITGEFIRANKNIWA